MNQNYDLRHELLITSLALDLACNNLAGVCGGQRPNQLRLNIRKEIEHQLTLHSPEQLQKLYRYGEWSDSHH